MQNLGIEHGAPYEAKVVSLDALPKPRMVSVERFRKAVYFRGAQCEWIHKRRSRRRFHTMQRMAGRTAGFEFKMGECGVGDHRAGKQVDVPSNTF